MAGKPRDFAVMLKDNPWNRRRTLANMQYQDIADILGGTKSKWGMYFSGQNMPKPAVVHKLCELFGVDFDEGYRDFENMHLAWKSTRGHNKKVADGKPTEIKEKENKKMKDEPTNKAEPCENENKWNVDDVREDKDIDYIRDYVLSLLYQKVDYETFKKVDKALEDLK